MSKSSAKSTPLCALLLCLLLAGCQPPDPTEIPMLRQVRQAGDAIVATSTRFEVTRAAVFRDNIAYDGLRGVYIIVDKETGKEYIGVSGIGISELGQHRSGKSSRRDER